MTKKNDNDLPSLDELDRAIKKAKKESLGIDDEAPSETTRAEPLRISVELVAGVFVGVFIGFGLDKWLGTAPVFLLICFFLGVAGGGLNVYRLFKNDSETVVTETNKNEEE